jgi:DNA-binding NarL/FixJ family response regulator
MSIQRRILVVEDEPLLRNLLVSLLKASQFDAHSAANAAEAIKLAKKIDPDLALVDIDLGDGPNGINFSKILTDTNPGVAVVFLTHIADPRLLGISDNEMPKNYAYLLKSKMEDPGVLVSVIESALRDEVTREQQDNRQPNHPFTKLSKSQLDVLRLLAAGLSATQIAERRGTSARAVRNIITRACLAAGIEHDSEANARLLAVREYIRFAGIPSDG